MKEIQDYIKFIKKVIKNDARFIITGLPRHNFLFIYEKQDYYEKRDLLTINLMYLKELGRIDITFGSEYKIPIYELSVFENNEKTNRSIIKQVIKTLLSIFPEREV